MKLTPDQIGKSIRLTKDRWIDSIMRKHLPRRIYQQMHTPDQRRLALGWLDENGYHVEHHKEGQVVVKKGDKILAQCKVVLDLDTPEDLLTLAGALRK